MGFGFAFGAVTTISGIAVGGAALPLVCAKLFGVSANDSATQSDANEKEITRVNCGGTFSPREGKFALKYFLVGPKTGRKRRKQ